VAGVAAAEPGAGARTGAGHGEERATPRRARPAPARLRLLALHPGDRDVLWLYLLTRVAVGITAYCTVWLFPADRSTRDAGPVLTSFQQWDWGYYLHIARDGYFPGQSGPGQPGWDNREAFFPGFPMLLRAVHLVVPSWTAAGLTVSWIAGAVAVLALARIARPLLDPGPAGSGSDAPAGGSTGATSDPGRSTVLFLLVSPCAVFLAVGYTEALFLALALPAWLAARKGHWPQAAALTALATTVRVNGLFLAAALALQFILTARTARQWRRLPWLALPALPAFLYSWYLHANTGDWLAWKHAEERGWYRNFHAPWVAWSHTWTEAFGHTQATGYGIMAQAELLAMVVGVLLLALLLRRRHWPEALYLGVSLWALGTSYWYMSIPRSSLLWWPLWTTLAAWGTRRPRFRTAYLCLSAPLATILAVTFLSGRWAG
jgi:hypothetical protein